MSITELSIKRPSLVIVVFAMLTLLGLWSFAGLRYELLPSITPPFVSVTTVYPGASPSEVETNITKPLEDAVATVDQIKRLWSTSSDNVSNIFIEFTYGSDVNEAVQSVQRRVNETLPLLPEDAKAPEVSKFALDELPVLRLGVTAAQTPRDLVATLKNEIVPRLSQVKGVGRVLLVGGEEREIAVAIDPDKLRSYGIALAQVAAALNAAHLDIPAGRITAPDRDYSVRVIGKAATVTDLARRTIAVTPQGAEVRLADVAEIRDTVAEPAAIVRVNGVPAVGLLLQKQADANTVEVCRNVQALLAELEEDYAEIGLKLEVAQDGSLFTRQAATAVSHDLLLAVLLVALVMLAFLHSVRDPLIVMVAIPTSLVTTFIGMAVLGFTLNLMTLLGMSLAIGILVDDAMVVHENIARHVHLGKDKRAAALDGRNEIGFSALAITLVDVVVFVPLALLPGLVGNIIRQFAGVMVVSTLVSLAVSFTLTPMLASRFIKHYDKDSPRVMARFGRAFERAFTAQKAAYVRVLRLSLRHPFLVIGLAALLWLGSLSLLFVGAIGSEFVTMSDRSELSIVAELQAGASLSQTDATARRIEALLLARPEVRKVFTVVGQASQGYVGELASHAVDFSVSLVPPTERKKSAMQVSQELKAEIQKIPGALVRVAPIGIFGTANEAPIQIVVSGPDRERVLRAAEQLADIARRVRGTDDVRLLVQPGKPETRVEVDHDKLASLGLSLADVGLTLRLALTGDDRAKMTLDERDVPIRVRLAETSRRDPAALARLTFLNGAGTAVELQQFASIRNTLAPSKLERRNRIASASVYAETPTRPAGDVGADIQAAVAAASLSGVRIAYEGELENQSESFARLAIAFIAALIAVYLVMVALYDSFIHPLVVLFSIPMAIVGALVVLAASKATLNIFSILGMIVLVGLVGKNAILLVDRTNAARAEGLGTVDALIDAAQQRLRPILMTTAAMVFGMLPIALATGAAAEWKNGLAWVLIGGLTSSLFLTLLLVPVIYATVEKARGFLRRRPGSAASNGAHGAALGDSTAGRAVKAAVTIALVLATPSWAQAQTAAVTPAISLAQAGATESTSPAAPASSASGAALRLSLREAVAMALENNTALRVHTLEEQKTDEGVRLACGELLPTLRANGQYVRNLRAPVFYMPTVTVDPSTGALSFGKPLTPIAAADTNVYQGSLVAEMPIFHWQAISAVRLAKAQARVMAVDRRTLAASTVAEVRNAYYGVLLCDVRASRRE